MLSLFKVDRGDMAVVSELADKSERFVQCESGGVVSESVEDGIRKSPALTDHQAQSIARLLMQLEEAFGTPQDFEWGIEKGKIPFLLY